MSERRARWGKLWPEYWIACGRCETRVQLPQKQKAKAEKTAWAAGWRFTDAHGWVCPEHASKPTPAARRER